MPVLFWSLSALMLSPWAQFPLKVTLQRSVENQTLCRPRVLQSCLSCWGCCCCCSCCCCCYPTDQKLLRAPESGAEFQMSWHLCFDVCFLPFASFRAYCERGRSRKEIHWMGTYWQWVSAATLTSYRTVGQVFCWRNIKWEVRQAASIFRHWL